MRFQALFLALLFLAGMGSANAQELPENVDLTYFFPSASQGALFTLDTSEVAPVRSFRIASILGFALSPLVAQKGNANGSIITNVSQLFLAASFGLGKNLEIGAILPLTGFYREDLTVLDGEANNRFGRLGDFRLRGKANLLPIKDRSLGVSVLAEFVLPTGAQQSLFGAAGPEFTPTMILEYLRGSLSLSGNIGYTIRAATEVGSATIDDRLNLGAGVGYTLSSTASSRLLALLEGQINLPGNIGAGSIESETPIEIRIGGKYFKNSTSFQAGIGRGFTEGIGAPAFRIFAGVGFTSNNADSDEDGIQDSRDQCPTEPEDFDDYQDEDGCPEADNDNDGVLDFFDRCPDEKEDFDSYFDDDGCPEPDNDEDKILDANDQCPTEPEDFDDYQDEDGCPEADNDNDGISDRADECPSEPEDLDGVEDEDGCPDVDTDGDGISDPDDHCPTEPENFNEYQDEDGCPDVRPLAVLDTEKKGIVIYEQVYFRTGKSTINPASHKLLDTVAQILNENPEIALVRIEGHTDDVGKETKNLTLSIDRAKAVVSYLIKTGKVDSSRLVSQGYGETCPVKEGQTDETRALNRRVAFIILDEGEEPTGTCRAKRIEVTPTP